MVGCGGGELRTSAPAAHHVQQVFDVDDTVAVSVTCTCRGAVVETSPKFAELGVVQSLLLIFPRAKRVHSAVFQRR